MRRHLILAPVMLVVLANDVAAADRKSEVGTVVDAGIARTPFVGGGADTTSMIARPGKPAMTEVATYVIETDDTRFELRDTVAIGPASLNLRVGSTVMFAVNKKTAYVRRDDGSEHRLLVSKKTPKRR